MRKLRWMTVLAVAVYMLLLGAAKVSADDVEFKFTIPTIPDTPIIESVSNSSAIAGQDSFTVYATINGQTQLEACCNGTCTHECEPNCDFSACEMEDYTGQADPRVIPNPTCIPNANDTSGGSNSSTCGGKSGNPKVYYYYSGDTSNTASVDMTYNSTTGKFEGVIPITGLSEGDEVTYYIVAVDSRGNVVAQVPDPETAPCTTISSWASEYSTPDIDNCQFANSYEECGKFKSGTPTCYSSNNTVRDIENDTCDVDGNTTSGLGLVDILGFSAGAGKGFSDMPNDVVVCTQITLGANPPDPGTSSGAIEAYLMIFFNPDMPDSNPYDVHMENVFAITYAPEAAGADPNLVKVLWDGECVTNPNTADILGCKLIVGSLSETTLQIGAAGGKLSFIAKNSLPNGDTILGSTHNSARLIMVTGDIDLSGSTPFWLVDLSVGLSTVKENKTVTVEQAGKPAATLAVNPGECKASGASSYTTGTCPQSTSEPDSNECKITLYASPDAGFTGEYKIYVNTVDDASSATYDSSITSNISGTNYFQYVIGDDTGELLDGKTYYFFFTSVNDSNPDMETDMSEAAKSKCTVEDWVPPAAPNSMSCATPDGNEGICECTWNMDTLTDPSVQGFFISRDSVNLNTSPFGAVPNQSSYQYSYTDNDTTTLELGGGPYTYRIKALDAGGNQSTAAGDGSDTDTCTPEDLKKPGKISSLSVTLKSGIYGVDLSWEQGEDEDLAGYNVYKCEVSTSEQTDCQTKDDYLTGGYNEKINSSMIDNSGTLEVDSENFPQTDTMFCFWVEACDNCDTAGTCPSKTTPNCSNHDTTTIYRKCLTITSVPDPYKPDLPTSVSTTASAVGGACEITFSRVTSDDEGAFENSSYPTPVELMGYYLMRTEAIGGDCTTTPLGNPGNLGSSIIAGTVTAAQQLEDTLDTTDDNNGDGLTNGTQYCYTVYSYDAAGNFKTDTLTSSQIGSCTPADTKAPDKPVMEPMVFDEYSCTPSWGAVTDKDSVTYNVYRCDDKIENCTTTGDYALLGDGTGIQTTTLQDYNVTTDDDYTYCASALDPSSNESTVYESSDLTNCQVCTPSNRPAAPDATTAWQFSASPNYGAKACWTDSTDYDVGGQGYNLYACKTDCNGKEASTCCDLQVETGYTGSHACTDGNEWVKNTITVTETADYYIGVTYVNDNGIESFASLTSNAVNIETQDACVIDPSVCKTVIKLKKPVKKMLVEACTGADIGDATACKATGEAATGGSCKSNGIMRKCEVPQSGLKVELVPITGSSRAAGRDYGTPIKTGITNASGTVEFMVPDSDIQAGTEYVVRLRVDNYDTAMENMCDNDASSDGFCGMDLTDPAEIDTSGDTVTMEETPPTLPPNSSDGGFTGDIGNFNGDGNVNALDLAKLKPAWGSPLGTDCYRTWADVNMDGNINALDLATIKGFWGKPVDSSAIDPSAPGAMVAGYKIVDGVKTPETWPPDECK